MYSLRIILLCGLVLLCCAGLVFGESDPDPTSAFKYDCGVYPNSLDFGMVDVGRTSERDYFRVSRYGDGDLRVVIPPTLGDFHFARPGEFIEPTDITVLVDFRPQTAGAQACTLWTGPDCEGNGGHVVLRGFGMQREPAVDMDCRERDFGMALVGETVSTSVRIVNIGNSGLTGVTTVTGDGFHIPEEERVWYIARGGVGNFTVRFSPEGTGHRTGSIDFGNELCCVIDLGGTGTAASGQDDVIGLYFQQSGQSNRFLTTEPYEEVTAYLMIVNPSSVTGVRGWECCVEMAGAGTGMTWELAGEAMNIDTPPCFTVGMSGYALTGDNLITLATLRFYQPSPDVATWFYIHPATRPSVEGYPCYVDGVHDGLQIPLGWACGSETVPVAIINDPAVGGVESVPPVVEQLGNHPNPFNPGTTISFVLGTEMPVTLRVYDLGGRVVHSLLGGEVLGAGRCEIPWDGRDESGRIVAAGAYFYRLDAGEYRETKRMMLVK